MARDKAVDHSDSIGGGGGGELEPPGASQVYAASREQRVSIQAEPADTTAALHCLTAPCSAAVTCLIATRPQLAALRGRLWRVRSWRFIFKYLNTDLYFFFRYIVPSYEGFLHIWGEIS